MTSPLGLSCAEALGSRTALLLNAEIQLHRDR